MSGISEHRVKYARQHVTIVGCSSEQFSTPYIPDSVPEKLDNPSATTSASVGRSGSFPIGCSIRFEITPSLEVYRTIGGDLKDDFYDNVPLGHFSVKSIQLEGQSRRLRRHDSSRKSSAASHQKLDIAQKFRALSSFSGTAVNSFVTLGAKTNAPERQVRFSHVFCTQQNGQQKNLELTKAGFVDPPPADKAFPCLPMPVLQGTCCALYGHDVSYLELTDDKYNPTGFRAGNIVELVFAIIADRVIQKDAPEKYV
ncbi:hypothetical protein B0H11DRAFT_1918812 [Mycena galericulata]|nr:hypothetical protein B0H11DRAFT_1918812 [Mycena galericulata]